MANKSVPSLKSLTAIAKALKCEVSDLLPKEESLAKKYDKWLKAVEKERDVMNAFGAVSKLAVEQREYYADYIVHEIETFLDSLTSMKELITKKNQKV